MIRKVYNRILERLEEDEAIVVTGMRRVGKTTLLRQIYDGLATKNKIFLDLENPVNQKYFEEENYESIKYQLELLGIDSQEKACIFLDEVQFVKNVPSVVKYLIDHYKWKFFLTGSASFYLKNLFSESLAGRKIIYELFPLDFEEFLELKGSTLKIPDRVTKATYETFIPFYKEYIEFGGFPGVVGKSSVAKKKEALGEIFTSYFQKEILTLGGFRNNLIIRDLILLLCGRLGSKLDIQKLSVELGVARQSLNEYLAFLEGTYFISLVHPFSTNKDVEIRGAKKVYFCDSGLVNHLVKAHFGSLFENAIYHQLREKGEIKYYQRKSGVEIDFIVDKKSAWEVKVTPHTRDLDRLTRLAGELRLKEGRVVSFEYTNLESVYGFQII